MPRVEGDRIEADMMKGQHAPVVLLCPESENRPGVASDQAVTRGSRISSLSRYEIKQDIRDQSGTGTRANSRANVMQRRYGVIASTG